MNISKEAKEVTKRVNTWLKKYGKTYNDPDFGYPDCDMIDGCIIDLDINKLETDHRKMVGELVDDWIREHS